MALPKFLQPYLASYDLAKLREDDSAVRRELTTQILNSGDDRSLRWLFKNYSLREIKEILRRPQKGVWFKDSLRYWSKILGISFSRLQSQKAILKL